MKILKFDDEYQFSHEITFDDLAECPSVYSFYGYDVEENVFLYKGSGRLNGFYFYKEVYIYEEI